MSGDRTRNTEGLRAHAKRKKEASADKADSAIQRLTASHKPINFNTVSIGVSKAYLYNHPGICGRIEALRAQERDIPAPAVKRNMTDKSKDTLIAAKNKRIRDLEAENKQLKMELARLRGKQYDQM